MYALDKVKLNIAKLVNEALAPLDGKNSGIKNRRRSKHLTGMGQKLVSASSLVYPPNPDFGDFSLPMFGLAKELEKTPVAAAEFLVGEIKYNNIIISAKAIGPYLNFIINKKKLAERVVAEISKEKGEYGRNKKGKNKRVMIEYSNANTHKEYHIGHLRNLCYGDAVSRILSANGYHSISVSYINDFGIHAAKTIWAYDKFFKKKKLFKNKGYFLGQVYVRAVQELEKDPLAVKTVGFIMKKIESRKGAEFKLWERTRKWSIDSFDKIYKELGVKFDHIFYESEFIDQGIEMVANLYNDGFLIRSDGAIVVNLEKYGLGVLLFLRSDRTALYPVADLPLAIEKFKRYKLDESIYVVDIRQSLYFKQLFKVLELLGHKKKMVHLGYDVVKLPDGMMSSRMGRVITYEDLRQQLLKRAISETKKRHKDWSEKKVGESSAKIANGAIKFEMIKVGANQTITFDINKALRFDGFTAAYLQYAYARTQSIIKKAFQFRSGQAGKEAKIDFENLDDEKERGLIIKLAKYPEAVLRAGENYDPSEIAKYLFELAREFNDYYHSVPVLKSRDAVRAARLSLIGAVSQVIANGLGLLGIETMVEM